MTRNSIKAILWENVLSLMRARYGGENLTRLARETGISPGSTTRIKSQDTSVGVDMLERIAANFGVEPWQLIAPDLGKAARSAGVRFSALATEAATMLDEIPDRTHQRRAFAQFVQLLESSDVVTVLTPNSGAAP